MKLRTNCNVQKYRKYIKGEFNRLNFKKQVKVTNEAERLLSSVKRAICNWDEEPSRIRDTKHGECIVVDLYDHVWNKSYELKISLACCDSFLTSDDIICGSTDFFDKLPKILKCDLKNEISMGEEDWVFEYVYGYMHYLEDICQAERDKLAKIKNGELI